jgi:hypothetical protein
MRRETAVFYVEIEDKRNYMGAALGLRYGLLSQELLVQNEYLAAENRILQVHPHARGM